jgi:glycosyltransferase involved in cell wall biosynthesis
MNKKSLDFLLPMFPFSHFSNFSILIVNQTQDDSLLESNYPTVRVINSLEKGLSKSRNLAIQNANKKICLIADDDVVYFPNFEEDIIKAFNDVKEASIITFNHQRVGADKPQNVSNKSYLHTRKSIYKVVSIEIAFKSDSLKGTNIYFDENFGLGSFFETAEEFLFLRKAIQFRLKLYFYPNIIVTHPTLCSGEFHGEDRLVFARSALFYKIKGVIAYLWLIKHIFFLVKNSYIFKNQSIEKFKIGLAGIKQFKKLTKR